MYNGKLITFCGLDGGGKTTMITFLQEYLLQKEYTVHLVKQPSEELRKSKIFRSIVDNQNEGQYDSRALSLIAAGDRLQHSNKVILPLLDDEKNIVISDRYYFSCIANHFINGNKNDDWIYDVYEYFPKPDMAFFLDVDVKTALHRIRSRPQEKSREINEMQQHKLRKEYLRIAQMYDGIVINSDSSPVDTFSKIKEYINKII